MLSSPLVGAPGSFVIVFDRSDYGPSARSLDPPHRSQPLRLPPRPQAIITGGASGIGLGIAMAMADAGYEVTATGLTEEQVASVPRHPHLSAVQLDVTSP